MSFSSRRRNYMLVSHRRDQFIEFIKGLLQPSFVLDALAESASNSWAHVEELVEEYRHETPGEPSRLRTAVPSLGIFHTALPLEPRGGASRFKVSAALRRAELQRDPGNLEPGPGHGLRAVAAQVRVADGDCTLYSGGKNSTTPLAGQIERLLAAGVTVALVTAAGYGYEADKYEKRLEGLLRVFDDLAVPADALRRFYVCGGECNYLLQLDRDAGGAATLRSREATWDVTFEEAAALLGARRRASGVRGRHGPRGRA
ncbi:hypothetical protein JL720_4887 [Aureococcus anophagefferens]|nr:hypothetical protein JL720_4887 [Aureococcus anophagefferens]